MLTTSYLFTEVRGRLGESDGNISIVVLRRKGPAASWHVEEGIRDGHLYRARTFQCVTAGEPSVERAGSGALGVRESSRETD